MKLSAQGSIRFDLQSGRRNYFTHAYAERFILFAFNYKQQDPFNQLDIGMQFFLDPLVLGVWYRGLPSKNNLPNNEAIIGLMGVSLQGGLDIGYSYDITVSKLGLRNSGGAHEVSGTYSFLWGDPKVEINALEIFLALDIRSFFKGFAKSLKKLQKFFYLILDSYFRSAAFYNQKKAELICNYDYRNF
jgi:hypothetical protein